VNGFRKLEGPFFGHVLLSSDGGKSWALGGNESIGLDENQAVALPEPGGASCVGAVCPGSRSFLLNARNDGNCSGADVPTAVVVPQNAGAPVNYAADTSVRLALLRY
jgi:hypothetical protein